MEVKRNEQLNVYQAVEQAKAECKHLLPVVAHRKNRTDWVISLPATLFYALATKYEEWWENEIAKTPPPE